MINIQYTNIGFKSYMILESENLENSINYINKNDVTNISISTKKKFNLTNLDFLVNCKSINRVVVDDSEGVIEKKGILNLNGLIELIVDKNKTSAIDLSNFHYLKMLTIDYHENWLNIFFIKSLECLRIYEIKIDLIPIDADLPNLTTLEIAGGKLSSTEGVEIFENLEVLNLHLLSKLRILKFTREMPNLKKLFIEDCKKIEKISGFEFLPNLQELIILNCKSIPSCDFLINSVPNLNKVTIKGTKILDGSEANIVRFKEYFYGNDKPLLSHLLPR